MLDGEVVVVGDGRFHAGVVARVIGDDEDWGGYELKGWQWNGRRWEGIDQAEVWVRERADGGGDGDLRAEGRDIDEAIVFDADLLGVEEDAECGADAVLAVAAGIEGEAYAWGEVEVGGGDTVLLHGGVAGEEQACGALGNWVDLIPAT